MLLRALYIILYPLVDSDWSYSPETPNLGQNRRFFELCDLEIWPLSLTFYTDLTLAIGNNFIDW